MSRLPTRSTPCAHAGARRWCRSSPPAIPRSRPRCRCMHALVAAGADVIELGVPFSDPMADGPTIQRSSERALARGAGLAYVLDSVRAFRERDADTPVVLMGYLNPSRSAAPQRFAHDAVAGGRRRRAAGRPAAGGSRRAPRRASTAHGLALILLASPTTAGRAPAPRCATTRRATCTTSASPASPAPTGSTPAPPAERLQAICARSARAGAGRLRHQGRRHRPRRWPHDADGVVVGSALVAALADAADPAAAGQRASSRRCARRWTPRRRARAARPVR